MKRVFQFLLYCWLFLPIWGWAQVDDWDGTAVVFARGSGTADDPYLIETAENLAYIAQMVNSGVTTYRGLYFRMTTNINLRNFQWTPIGGRIRTANGGLAERSFQGNFDGGGYSIDNLYINLGAGELNSHSMTGDHVYYHGLFGYASRTRISRVIVKGNIVISVQSANPVGGICGSGGEVTFTDCCFYGTISCDYTVSYGSSGFSSSVGGICGSGGIFVNCSNYGNISVIGHDSYGSSGFSSSVGGICGSGANSVNCSNYGDISSSTTYSFAGGICGRGNVFTSCINRGEISAVANIGSTPSAGAGGICGNGGNVFTSCINYGEVSAECNLEYSYASGVCVSSASASLIHCANYGRVSSYGRVGFSSGISVNTNYNAVHITECCYNMGEITRGSGIGGGYNAEARNCYNAGRLVGSSTIYGCAPSATNCYYLDTCGATTGGIPKTEAEMKAASFLALLNTDSVVFAMDVANINQGYPIFASGFVMPQTLVADNIHGNTATLHGSYYADTIDAVGFEYKPARSASFTKVYAQMGSPVAYTLTGLDLNTTYEYRIFVERDSVTYYGHLLTFETQSCSLSASITPSSATLCQGDTATLAVVGHSTPTHITYQWSNHSTAPSIQVTETGTYSVTISDTNGCATTLTTSIVFHPRPEGHISGALTICSGQTTTLNASGAESYRWSTGAVTPSIAVNSSGTYTCTFTNDYHCTSSQSVEVVVFSRPIIVGNTTLCSGGTTTLTATAGDTYRWSTGDTTPTITIYAPGTYSVMGSSSAGCSGSSAVTVEESPLPVVTILGNTTLCEGNATTLTAIGGTSYQWSNGASGNSIMVNRAGTYSVTATSAAGCANSESVNVIVNPLPTIDIMGSTTTCQGNPITLAASGAQSYQWSNGATGAYNSVGNSGDYLVVGYDANGCSNTAAITITVNPTYNASVVHSICQGESYNFFGQNLTTTGIYTHRLFSRQGCDSIITLTLTVHELPNVNIIGNTQLCQGESSTLVVSGGTTYRWSNGEVASSIVVNSAGTYSVTATSSEGCSKSESVNVVINPLPTITITGNTTICEGNSTMLTALGAASYSWNNGVNGATNRVSQFGVYTVTGVSAEGCSSTASTTIIVNSLPVIYINGDTDLCQGESTTLTASGATSYLWNNGSTGATITTTNEGRYAVIGTDDNGCSNTASVAVSVHQPTQQELTITACDRYNWNGHSYTSSGDYIWNGESIYGCDSVVILHLAINPSITQEISETSNGSYLWNGNLYTESGDYIWTGTTVAGCDSIVVLHLAISTGIDDSDSSMVVKVWPNPTNGVVNLFCDREKAQVQLFDVMGRCVYTDNLTQQLNRIDITKLSQGIYLLHIVVDDKIVGKTKILKQ